MTDSMHYAVVIRTVYGCAAAVNPAAGPCSWTLQLNPAAAVNPNHLSKERRQLQSGAAGWLVCQLGSAAGYQMAFD